ncbi:MAG: hypothetical protein MUC47_04555, partial [Candidatus Kapabacteria bacterium]|nr:hypothetical protein [Candidatus Kapabacteria bacterium]
MPEFTIESNGRIEKTAIYYNGDQLAGVREIFLNIDEEGTFDAVVQYTGSDDQLYTKQVFTDYFENAKTREPAFTEEEAQTMRQLTVISEGDIDTATVLI